MNILNILCSILLLSVGATSYAFESTKTLPKGVRNLNVKGLYTTTSNKTNASGDLEPLAEPLWRPLRFRNIVAGEKGLKKTQLEAFLLSQNINQNDTAGDFRADLNAQINVWAPVFAWGITDRLTLAAALPYYSSSTDVKVGFRTNAGAQRFLAALTTESMNNYQSAVEAAEKFQNAVGRLNERLQENAYQALEPWNKTAWGDLTIASKYLAYDGETLKLAGQFGVNAPTGRTDNPDILTDLPFGDGQWDVFGTVLSDQYLNSSIFFNQFFKYTYQSPDRKNVRWKTYEETVEAPRVPTDYKLGDKIDAGLSMQFEQESTGLTGGLGGLYFRKFSDRYEVDLPEVRNELQRQTGQNALYWQARLGYTTLPAFHRKDFALPLSASIEYRKQFQSRNVPVTDFTQVDLNLFF
jgi:hypothetical protein